MLSDFQLSDRRCAWIGIDASKGAVVEAQPRARRHAGHQLRHFGDDVPVDQNFHARRLPNHAWRHTKRSDGIEAVIQLHRLREVLALVGFTRFEAVTPDINGEYETDVERAQIALEPSWFPAVENRGEGMFVQLRAADVMSSKGRHSRPRACQKRSLTSVSRMTRRTHNNALTPGRNAFPPGFLEQELPTLCMIQQH
jgi:hypothetical protein